MLEKYLSENTVAFNVDVNSPVECIRYVGELLVKNNKVKREYINDMLDVYEKLGSYIVLAPGIAFPHAKPGEHVNETCLSLCTLKKPIAFHHQQNDPVKIVIALGGVNEMGHIDMLRELSQFLMHEGVLEELNKIDSYADLKKLLEKERRLEDERN